MFVSIQIPIADARPFADDSALRLPVPDWPNPETDIRPQFIHRFGRTVERRRDTDEAWPDEIKFCRIHRALRFHELEKCHAGHPHPVRLQCSFRRLLSDGQAVGRIEIGLRTMLDDSLPAAKLDPTALLSIVTDVCDLPTDVPVPGAGLKRNRLVRQGAAVARLYAHSTIDTAAAGKLERATTLVEAGDPVVLCELDAHEADSPLPLPSFKDVSPELTRGVRVAFGRVQTHSGVVGVWLLQRGPAAVADLRSLRICLMRLHAEQEVLDLVLKQIQRRTLLNPATSDAVDSLDEYFNRRTRLVNREWWQGIRQSAIREAINASDQLQSAPKANLTQRYEGARRQVWAKIESYQAERNAVRQVSTIKVEPGGHLVIQNTKITGNQGIINIGEYISNVTNTINSNLAKCMAGDEVKDLVAQLAKEISALAPKADVEAVQKMGKSAEALSKEITQAKPERAWYELSLKGIKEAAEAVGEIAKPVLAVVAKLTPLLLG